MKRIGLFLVVGLVFVSCNDEKAAEAREKIDSTASAIKDTLKVKADTLGERIERGIDRLKDKADSAIKKRDTF